MGNLEKQLQDAKALITTVETLQSNTAAINGQALDALKLLQLAASEITTTRTAVEQDQAAITTKSAHIQDACLHADKVRVDLDAALVAAQQSATNSESQNAASKVASDNLSALVVAAQAAKTAIDVHVSLAAERRQQCDEHAEVTKKLSDTAAETDERIANYESKLSDLDREIAKRMTTIDSLLPGATSAGLASAFRSRCAHFVAPQKFWQWVFLGALGGLIAVAAGEYWAVTGNANADIWQSLGMSLLRRLPLVLPLIWLAIHASHKGALAQRVEEDYAFKETVSSAFEGYRREMKELEGKAAPDSPLARYCEGVLSVITNPPGRIYEKHSLSQTPLNALAEFAGPIAEAISKLTKAGFKIELPGIPPAPE